MYTDTVAKSENTFSTSIYTLTDTVAKHSHPSLTRDSPTSLPHARPHRRRRRPLSPASSSSRTSQRRCSICRRGLQRGRDGAAASGRLPGAAAAAVLIVLTSLQIQHHHLKASRPSTGVGRGVTTGAAPASTARATSSPETCLPINSTLSISFPRVCKSFSVLLGCRADTAKQIPAPGPNAFAPALPPLPALLLESPVDETATPPGVESPPTTPTRGFSPRFFVVLFR